MAKRDALFQSFFKSYQARFPEKKGNVCQKEVTLLWQTGKEEKKNPGEFEKYIEHLISSYEQYCAQRKAKNMLFFMTTQKKKGSVKTAEKDDPIVKTKDNDDSAKNNPDFPELGSDVNVPKKHFAKPAQKKAEENIISLTKQVSALNDALNSMPSEKVRLELEKSRRSLEQEQKSLKRKKQIAEAQRKFRDIKKSKMSALVEEIPEAQRFVKKHPSAGRPSIEEDQSFLHKVIMDIAMFGSAADERRRSNIVRSVRTLSDLHQELETQGFILSRTSTYLRLLPKNSRTIEGQRHIRTVPVKLIRAQTEQHRHHIDSHFATASIKYLEGLAAVLGPNQVFFLSQDDKARVPIGLTAANKQAPLLMHVEYKVKLPDHDWVIAPKHKLIPSVYGGVTVNPEEIGNPKAVGYSGPTYVAIRSGKHCSSTAASHAKDFDTLLNLDAFKNIAKTEKGEVKPVIIMTSDGGPDENPRYAKVIYYAIDHFKNYNLDAVFIATNAPGRSAYNRVERRMAPLSRALAGLILPHDKYGSHLNDQGKTVDAVLEEKNFQNAGEVLATIWNEMHIDEYPVTAEYVLPNEAEKELQETDPYWYQDHVRESQYFLQIVKCRSEKCCGKFRSGLLKILPERFFPPPVRITQTADDLIVARDNKSHFLDLVTRRALDLPLHEDKKYLQVPYDLFCPSMATQLQKRVCKICGLYFASQKSVKQHSKVHKKGPHNLNDARKEIVRITARRNSEVLDIEENSESDQKDIVIEPGMNQSPSSDGVDIPIIDDLTEWLKNPFEPVNN